MEKHSKSFEESYEKLKGFLTEAVGNAEKYGKNINLSSSKLQMAYLALPFIEGSTENKISSFLTKSFPHWERISNSDSEELINNIETLFERVPSTYLDEIKTYLVDEEIISNKMKLSLWSIVHQMCRSCISYCHLKRNPINGKYTVEFAPGVSVKKGVEFFKIDSHN